MRKRKYIENGILRLDQLLTAGWYFTPDHVDLFFLKKNTQSITFVKVIWR